MSSTATETTVKESLGRIREQHGRIVSGQTKLGPGQPTEFTGAESPGDCRAQGDLNLIWRENGPPKDYVLRTNRNVQLVPGNTTGAKHCLDSVAAVAVYDPPGFGPEYEGLNGPFLVTRGRTTILHPTHGAVSIPAGSNIECRYQRNYDEELKRERRALD